MSRKAKFTIQKTPRKNALKIILLSLLIFAAPITSILNPQNNKDKNDLKEDYNINLQNHNPNVILKYDKDLAQKEKKHNAKENNNDEKIYLNFEKMTLASVINYLAERKKLNIIPNKELENIPVSMTTKKALSLQQAWDVVLTLLEENGYTIIEVDNLFKIVQNKVNQQEPLPVYSSNKGVEPEDLPDNDKIIRYIYFLKNIPSDAAATILDPMLQPNSIKINKDLEACIITEKSLHIKEAMKIVKKLDLGGSKESLRLIKLKMVDSDTIIKIFDEIIGPQDNKSPIRIFSTDSKKQTTYFSSSTRILSIPRQNAIILLGKEEHLNRIADFIHKYLDVPIGEAESRIHIKEIQYTSAEKLKPILDAIIRPPRGQSAEKILVGEYKFFEDVIIVAESSEGEEIRGKGNRLIIACNQDDWKRLDKFISKLDKPQPQVALEVMIIDVELKKDKFLGAQLQTKIKDNKTYGFQIAPGAWLQTLNLSNAEDLYDEITPQNGNTFPSNATHITARTGTGEKSLYALVKNIFKIDNTNIIAQPFLVVNNYQPCTLHDIETRLLQGKFLIGPTSGDNPPLSYDEANATTSLTITPFINTNGTVDLKINIDVQDFTTPLDPNRQKGDIFNRKLDTRATMRLGEVLVLGGLTKSKLLDEGTKTPIIGDIPIIGNLFKRKTRNRIEKNLYIFIRPSIIKPLELGGPDEYTQLKLDYAKYQILKNDSYFREKDPIQRWFFKPSNQKIKNKLSDAAKGIFRPIDNFTYRKNQPKTVVIKEDPYYRSSEEIEKIRKRKLKKRKSLLTSTNKKAALKQRRLKL